MNVLLLLVLVGAAIASKGLRAVQYSTVYTEYNQAGNSLIVQDYVPDLSTTGFDNNINSVCQTGMWIYYEQVQYNQIVGTVYWVHGIDYCTNLPLSYVDKTSSLKFVGSPAELNADSVTLYQGQYFTGSEFFATADSPSLNFLTNLASSIILTGISPWTFYEGVNYSGFAVCVYPTTDTDVGADGSVLNLGVYPTVTELGLIDNTIESVRKGCFSKNIVKSSKLKAVHRSDNGADGYFMV